MVQFIKAIEPNTTTINTKAGRRYIIEENDSYYTQRFGPSSLHYQIKNFRYVHSILKDPRTIIDVGMNIGMNTVEYSTFAKKVIGFEPTPWVYDWACKNIKWNKHNVDYDKPALLQGKKDLTAQIETHQMGLGANAQTDVTFFSQPKNNGHNSVAYNKNFKKDTIVRQFKADIATIDMFRYNDVDFIKIDTEGYELPVLQGAKDTIARCRPAIQCEIVPPQCRRANYQALDIWDFLVKQDYRVFTCDGVERTHGMTIEKNKLMHNGVKPQKMMDYFFIAKEKV